jgi:hypothetical protein
MRRIVGDFELNFGFAIVGLAASRCSELSGAECSWVNTKSLGTSNVRSSKGTVMM